MWLPSWRVPLAGNSRTLDGAAILSLRLKSVMCLALWWDAGLRHFSITWHWVKTGHWWNWGVGRGWLAYDIIAELSRQRMNQSMSFHAVEHHDEFFRACEQKLARHAMGVTRHHHAASLPDDRPLVVIANEFFDALPIRQYVYENDIWHERYVADGACYVKALSHHGEMRRSRVMDEASFKDGDVVEYSPAGMAWARALGQAYQATRRRAAGD